MSLAKLVVSLPLQIEFSAPIVARPTVPHGRDTRVGALATGIVQIPMPVSWSVTDHRFPSAVAGLGQAANRRAPNHLSLLSLYR